MSSIGDLFGGDLKALFSEEDDQPEEVQAADVVDELTDGDAPRSSSADSASVNRQSDAEVALRGILGELSHVEPNAIDLDLPLRELGAEGLGLWAVVAEIERQSQVSFTDAEVASWQTPSQILLAVESASS